MDASLVGLRALAIGLVLSTLCGSAAAADDDDTALPAELVRLFEQLDRLANLREPPAALVELTIANTEFPEKPRTETAWVLDENDESITVLRDDLVPWTYSKKKPTVVPSSWNPRSLRIESIQQIDREEYFRRRSVAEGDPEERRRTRPLSEIEGPSHRLLTSWLAWKNGVPKYCRPVIAAAAEGPKLEPDFAAYCSAVLTDLAWLHYLRGVNLLMYADRREVLPHLRLAIALAPESDHAEASKDLLAALEKLAAGPAAAPQAPLDQSKLTEDERARFYLSQLIDLRCPQTSQPGFIHPYVKIVAGTPDENTPTANLRKMGMKAAPHLLAALEDDTPTRTVYHHRDFAHSRLVWRVSDFAWHLLRDITKKEFGYQRTVGFTLGSMKPEERQATIAEIKRWYAANKDRSEDDRMFDFFTGNAPEDWQTAGEYFLARQNKRAVKPLVERIPHARDFAKGPLCELVGKFGDPSATNVLKQIMTSAPEASDRLGAAIGLWNLGDRSGIPVAIEFVKAKDQAYGSWDTPIWFLMRTRSKEGIEVLRSLVLTEEPGRAAEVIGFVTASFSGDLHGERHEPAGSKDIVPMLLAALRRKEETGGTFNDAKQRVCDAAAFALVVLRDGANSPFGGRHPQVDPKQFNQWDADESLRDRQIAALREWFARYGEHAVWDEKKMRLVVPGAEQ